MKPSFSKNCILKYAPLACIQCKQCLITNLYALNVSFVHLNKARPSPRQQHHMESATVRTVPAPKLTVSTHLPPFRSPEAPVPAGRRGAQPSAPGAAQLPSVCPQPGDLGAGAGRPGGRKRRGRRTARLSPGAVTVMMKVVEVAVLI